MPDLADEPGPGPGPATSPGRDEFTESAPPPILVALGALDMLEGLSLFRLALLGETCVCNPIF